VELMQLQEDMCQPGRMQFLGGKVISLGVPSPFLILHSHDVSHPGREPYSPLKHVPDWNLQIYLSYPVYFL
jgi:hypothetical protein